MRIGLDARYVYPSHVHGIGRYSAELVRHLAPLARSAGHELIVFRRPDLPEPLLPPGQGREVLVAFAPASLATVARLGGIARRERLDVFHALFPVMPVAPAARTVVTAHDLQALHARGFHGGRPWPATLASQIFYRLVYRWSFGAANRIVAGSCWTRDVVQATYALPSERFRVVHEGLSEAFFESGDAASDRATLARLGLDPAQPFLLHVGNTRPQKNVEGLLQIVHEVLERAPASAPARLVIAGVRDRFFPAVRDLALRLGLAEQVTFLTDVSDDALRALYRCATLYLTAARHEGFGFTPLEAMAAGCPVAAAAAGAIPEMLGDAYVPLDPDSPRGAACAILAVLSDCSRLAELARRGRERAQAFRWHQTALATLATYEELASADR